MSLIHSPRYSTNRWRAYECIRRMGTASLSDVSRTLCTSPHVAQSAGSNRAAGVAIEQLLTRGLIVEDERAKGGARQLSVAP